MENIHSRKGVSIEMQYNIVNRNRKHTLPQGSEYWNTIGIRRFIKTPYTPAREWVLKSVKVGEGVVKHTLPQGSEYWNTIESLRSRTPAHTLPQGSEYWNKKFWFVTILYIHSRKGVSIEMLNISLRHNATHTLPQGSEYWNDTAGEESENAPYTPAREWVLKSDWCTETKSDTYTPAREWVLKFTIVLVAASMPYTPAREWVLKSSWYRSAIFWRIHSRKGVSIEIFSGVYSFKHLIHSRKGVSIEISTCCRAG